MRLSLAHTRVERIAQRVAQHVEAQDDQRDHHGGIDHVQRIGTDAVERVVGHGAQRRNRRGDAQTDEAQEGGKAFLEKRRPRFEDYPKFP